jgi:hypothetical protein
MNDVKWAALAAAGLLAIVPEVQATATATATASFTNFQYLLVDLDPGDGISPSVTFNSDSRVSAVARDIGTSATTAASQFAGGAIGAPLAVSAVQGLSSAQARVFGGDPTVLGAGPSASVSASTSGFGNYAEGTASFLDTNFLLSPRSALVLSAGVANMSAGSLVAGESGTSIATLSLTSGSGVAAQSSFAQAWISFSPNGINFNLPSLLTASYANLSDTFLGGVAYANLTATVYSSPVPEPGTYALMLMGTLALAYAIRRDRTGTGG